MKTVRDWNGYCVNCGQFGHRSSSCTRFKGLRLARPE